MLCVYKQFSLLWCVGGFNSVVLECGVRHLSCILISPCLDGHFICSVSSLLPLPHLSHQMVHALLPSWGVACSGRVPWSEGAVLDGWDGGCCGTIGGVVEIVVLISTVPSEDDIKL